MCGACERVPGLGVRDAGCVWRVWCVFDRGRPGAGAFSPIGALLLFDAPAAALLLARAAPHLGAGRRRGVGDPPR